jgi:hypothetical protein
MDEKIDKDIAKIKIGRAKFQRKFHGKIYNLKAHNEPKSSLKREAKYYRDKGSQAIVVSRGNGKSSLYVRTR